MRTKALKKETENDQADPLDWYGLKGLGYFTGLKVYVLWFRVKL